MTSMRRREFLQCSAAAAAAALWPVRIPRTDPKRFPNILIITADDMGWDSLGVTGCPLEGITPNVDGLAAEGLRFEHGYNTVSVCVPSRQTMLTGRYPHRNGSMGLKPVDSDVPTLPEVLRAAGYLNGILGKSNHYRPLEKYCWDTDVPLEDLFHGRAPHLYREQARRFMGRAKEDGRPFFLLANPGDPHRPFPQDAEAACAELGIKNLERFRGVPRADKIMAPVTRRYKPEEVKVPGFLPDLPDVRKDLSHYYTAVRRSDETAGAVLEALDESGLRENTLVMWLSDNGMPFPFAKANCYPNSNRTPWIVRWPGRIKTCRVDGKHHISGIDLMPTVLEAAGLEAVPGMDGRSFLPILLGEEQSGRDRVFLVFNSTAVGLDYPMRGVIHPGYSYVYNAWSDGKKKYITSDRATYTMKAMEGDESMAERMRFYWHRAPEELYDLAGDPHALKNLVHDPELRPVKKKMREELLEMMVSTGDPLLETYKAYLSRAAGK